MIVLHSPFSEHSCTEIYCLDLVSLVPYRRNGPQGWFCAMCGPEWWFLSDSASAARQGRATKNEKMSSRYTSCLTLQLESGQQTLREIGKHVAASQREQPRWLSRYASVSFLIAFRSTLCTMCTLVHYVHVIKVRISMYWFRPTHHWCSSSFGVLMKSSKKGIKRQALRGSSLWWRRFSNLDILDILDNNDKPNQLIVIVQ